MLNRGFNSVFLLKRAIGIGKSQISSAPWEFEWSLKRILQIFKLNKPKYLIRKPQVTFKLFVTGFCLFCSKIGKR